MKYCLCFQFLDPAIPSGFVNVARAGLVGKLHNAACGQEHPAEVFVGAGLQRLHAGALAAAHGVEHPVGDDSKLGLGNGLLRAQSAVCIAVDDVPFI